MAEEQKSRVDFSSFAIKGERDLAKRMQAFEDYKALGEQRSAQKLYDAYIAENREHPENRKYIPTTDRNKIYEWRKIDEWDLKIAQLKAEQIEERNSVMRSVRDSARRRMENYAVDAVEALYDLAMGADKEQVRLQASEALLDRIGLSRFGRLNAAAPNDSDQPDDDELPDEGAGEKVIQMYLSKKQRKSG